MLSLGIDSGSTTTKGVLFDGTQIVETLMVPTTAKPKESLETVYRTLSQNEVEYTVSTGYGRGLLQQADKKITEITCHARGAAWLDPSIRVVIDIGGQDCKAILLNERQHVADFLMNDKCAAGTGRFIEMMMHTLNAPLDSIDTFVEGKKPASISSMCTVFAESEIVSLLAEGEDAGNIALGMIHAICRRTAFFAQKMNLEGKVFFTGGLAKFEIFRKTLEEYLKLEVRTHSLAQYAGAIGAAVIAGEKFQVRQ